MPSFPPHGTVGATSTITHGLNLVFHYNLQKDQSRQRNRLRYRHLGSPSPKSLPAPIVVAQFLWPLHTSTNILGITSLIATTLTRVNCWSQVISNLMIVWHSIFIIFRIHRTTFPMVLPDSWFRNISIDK